MEMAREGGNGNGRGNCKYKRAGKVQMEMVGSEEVGNGNDRKNWEWKWPGELGMETAWEVKNGNGRGIGEWECARGSWKLKGKLGMARTVGNGNGWESSEWKWPVKLTA